ncbi:MAG: heavy metal translocating P-type ATPase [Clostridia bacterium]|nr:heavy metal translocating P-type ATPase [Clostridia bacterium]
MNKKQQKVLIRIIVTVIMIVALHFCDFKGVINICLYLIPYMTIGYDILKKAVKGIKNRQPFDENFLMAVATVGAFGLGIYNEIQGQPGEYSEAVAVMLFYQIGELFQSVAVGKSRKNITELMDIRPDYANLCVGQEINQVDPDEVEIGSVILVKPGEKVPIDGVVIEGSSSLNTSALTGESVPRSVKSGDEIISGCINMTGLIKVRTTKEFGESTVSKILDLVENSSMKKSRSENFISRFAKYYTPVVCYSALALAVVPPVILLIAGKSAMWNTWIYRALTFLVISCPCALVISIPLGFFAGIGGASSCGVMVKGSNYLEALASVKTVVFDKTGTLTKGVFQVTEAIPYNGFSKDELIKYAAFAECYSTHPIAKSLREALDGDIDKNAVLDVEELSGKGIKASVYGKNILAGNERLMKSMNVEYTQCDKAGTIVYVAVDGRFAGYILISDTIKDNTREAVRQLRKTGVKNIVMLTGDSDKVAADVASKVGIAEYYSQLLPGDKVTKVEELLNNKPEKEKLAFGGDGINDAPVLTRSDIGIAMGALGSDAAIEAADVVLMDDDPLKIVKAIRIARKCLRIVYENIYFAIGIKVVCLVLGAVGIANMWVAIFADVGVMVLAVLNAIRVLFVKKL